MARYPKSAPVAEPLAEDAPIPAQSEPEGPAVVRNTVKGTVLHLGDGRKLAFGEEAEVSPELAAALGECAP